MTEFSPFHHMYAPLCALRTYVRAVWWSHLELGEGCRLEDIYIYIYIYIVIIVIVITTYHAVYWSYRASRADRWFLPRSIPCAPGLPEVAHSMTEDPEDRGYRPTRLWGQWQLHGVSISNGDGRWPVYSRGVRGQGTATQQHRNKQKARASLSGAKRQPRHKAARMRRSKSGPSVVRVPPPPWRRPSPVTPRNPLPSTYS